EGPSQVTLPCELGPGLSPPRAIPEVVWRAGIDLDPVDVTDDRARTWLQTLIWPEHEERRERLQGALCIARRDPPRVVRGNLLQALPSLIAAVPEGATPVVFHSSVLAYLAAEDRSRFVELVSGLRGRWTSSDGSGVRGCASAPQLSASDGRFVVAVDGHPRPYVDPHGRYVTAL